MSLAHVAPSRPLPPVAWRGPSRTAGVLLCVLALHGLALWALQSGLVQRVVEVVVPVDVLSALVEPPRPRQERPPPMQPAALKPAPVLAPRLVPAVVAPQPLAVPDSSPSPAAPTGVAVAPPLAPPQPVAVEVAAPALAPRVELPSSDAEYMHNPRPEYPRLSRQRGEQGKVVVNVFIGTDGLAQRAEVKVSSGFERLDQAALATARAWRYVPGKRGGVAEAMWFSVPINFVLE